MIVRQFRNDDLNEVSNIATRSLDESFDPSIFMFYHDQWPQAQLVYVDSFGHVIGFLNSTRLNPRTARINLLAVLPEFQGHGLGQILLNQFRTVMLMNGISSIELEVRKENYKAIGFYRKNGFIQSEILNHYYRNGGDAIRMTGPVQYIIR